MSVTPFISYAKEDREVAERLFRDLRKLGASPWLDVHNLVGGQPWESTIKRAVRECSHFIALLSQHSVSKQGFVQKELREALDVVDEYPPDKIFIVPARLDECTPVHEKLARLHWVDLFPRYSTGLKRVAVSLGLNTKPLPRAAAETRGLRQRQQRYPRVFVSCSTMVDRSRVQVLLSALLDANFDPVLGTSVIDRKLERNAIVASDVSTVVYGAITGCVAFISLQTKRDDYKITTTQGTRYLLPPWTVAEEVYAWARNVGLIIRLRDIAVDEPPYNRHVRTCNFESNQQFLWAVDTVVNELNMFRASASYAKIAAAAEKRWPRS